MAVFSRKIDHDDRLLAVVRRLVMETGRRHVGRYALAFLLTSFVAGSTAAVAYFVGDVINAVMEEKNAAHLYLFAGAVSSLFILRGLATFGYAVLLAQIGNAIVLELQVRLFRKVVAHEPSFVAQSSSGELTTLLSNGAASARNLLNTLILAVGRDILTLIGLLAVMIIRDPLLAMFMLVGLPIVVVAIAGITKRLRSISRRNLEATALLGNQIRGAIQGIRVVKAFGMEKRIGDVMAANADEIRRLTDKFAVVSNRVQPMMEIIAGIVFGAAVAFGGWRVLESGQSTGDLVSFLVAALLAYDPARRLGNARTRLEKEFVGVRTMYDFLDRENTQADPPNAPAFQLARGEIRFEDVRFAYDPAAPVLKGVSFVARAGETTAIVGRSGSGKTTIANLIQRFWLAQSGRVLVDGQDVAALRIESLRRQIAYVGQDAFVFDGTLRENLMVGDPDASEEAMIAAARAAGALDFIQRAPMGFDAPAGELGANLSGGQKQRIAVARALLRDSPIVVLDEPTSALDGETERAIQTSLETLAEGRTTIVIAHRLSTIRHAHTIIVVDEGQVVETGRHQDLIAANGVYARLYQGDGEPAPEGAPAEAPV